jgi:FtsH-binding integral membrane protein
MGHSNLFDTIFKCSCKHKKGKGNSSNGKHMVGGSIANSGNIVTKTRMLNSSEFLNLLNEKKTFLLMVFSNLIVQIGITYYIMMNYENIHESVTGDDLDGGGNNNTDNDPTIKKYVYLLFFIQLVLVFILALIPMASLPKFVIFSILSATFGMSLSYIIQIYNSINMDIVKIALLGTASIFGLMFLLGVLLVIFGLQIGMQFALFLFFSLLLLIIGRIVMLFNSSSSSSGASKAFSFIGLFLFALYIMYDTNHILQREYDGDFITASLDYYLDLINVFVNLLSVNNN